MAVLRKSGTRDAMSMFCAMQATQQATALHSFSLCANVGAVFGFPPLFTQRRLHAGQLLNIK
jgi:hypothetical protein